MLQKSQRLYQDEPSNSEGAPEEGLLIPVVTTHHIPRSQPRHLPSIRTGADTAAVIDQLYLDPLIRQRDRASEEF